MPRKKEIKAKVEEALQELKDEGVIASFGPIEVTCSHNNQEQTNEGIKCKDCGETL